MTQIFIIFASHRLALQGNQSGNFRVLLHFEIKILFFFITFFSSVTNCLAHIALDCLFREF